MSWFSNILKSTLTKWQPQIMPVRFRYHADKVAKGRLIRRYDYKERILQGGLLPRLDNGQKLPMPEYRCDILCILEVILN